MQKKMLKSFYLLLALMLVFSVNSLAFAQTGSQQGGNQQGQNPTEDQSESNDNNQQNTNQQQINAQQGGNQQGAQQGQQFGAQQGGLQDQQGTQQQGMTASEACLQTYTVQQGDTLGSIADRFLGDIGSYQLIVDATNAAVNNNQPGTLQQSGQQGTMQQGTQQQSGQQLNAQQGGTQGQQGTQPQTDQQLNAQQGGTQGQQGTQPQTDQQLNAQQGGTQGQQGTQPQTGQQFATQQDQQGSFQFTRIDDPNLIEVGQTLCIPSQQGFTQQGQPGMQQSGTTTGNQQQQGLMADTFSVPEGKSKILFENLSSRDLIVDISQGPTPQSMWIGPGQQQTFVVDPGQYLLMGHEPVGDFGITSEQVQLIAGAVISITCQEDGKCQTETPGTQGMQQPVAPQAATANLFSVPEGKSKVLFENLSSRDLIVDISQGPTPQSVWVGPGQQQVFVVDPGQYLFMGHEPAGEFGVSPGQIQLASGSIIGITCQEDSKCQTVEDLAMMQQDQPGTMQPSQQPSPGQGGADPG